MYTIIMFHTLDCGAYFFYKEQLQVMYKYYKCRYMEYINSLNILIIRYNSSYNNGLLNMGISKDLLSFI